MKRSAIACFLLGAAWIPAQGQSTPNTDSVRVRLGPLAYPRRALDAAGGTIALNAPPKRFVSLSGGTDEYLYQIVPPESIVGVSSSSYSKQFSPLLAQMNKYHPKVVKDLDDIRKLKPDLVLATESSSPEKVSALREAGIQVFQMFTLVTTLDQVAENISVVGYVTGNDGGARKERDRFEKEIAGIAAQCKVAHPEARIYGKSMTGFSYGDQTLFHDVVRLIGGVNLAAQNGLHTYDRVTKESVASWNPDWVFTWSDTGKAADELTRWKEDPALAKVPAVDKQQVVVVKANEMMPLSPLVTILARIMANATCKAGA